MLAVVVAVLRGPLSAIADVTEQGLWAIGHLSGKEENTRVFGSVGACKCEWCWTSLSSQFLLLILCVG